MIKFYNSFSNAPNNGVEVVGWSSENGLQTGMLLDKNGNWWNFNGDSCEAPEVWAYLNDLETQLKPSIVHALNTKVRK